MNDVPVVQEVAAHEYLVSLSHDDEVIEIRVHASPDIVTRIGGAGAAEMQIVEATVSYLIAPQRADDLPGRLDLDDVAAAYEDYVASIRSEVAQ